MYTKTATAVVLALLGVAKAGDLDPQPANLDALKATGKDYHRACTGASKATFTEAGQIAGKWECFTAAAAKSAEEAHSASKFCVQFTDADAENDKVATCSMHAGYGLAAEENDPIDKGAHAVYMLGGKYQDDAAEVDKKEEQKEEDGDKPPAPAPRADDAKTEPAVQRTCRCAGGEWVWTKVDGKKVPITDSAGEAVLDKDGNPTHKVEWGNCPETPTHYETNWLQLEAKPLPEGAAADAKPALNYPKACPPNWQIPVDEGASADQGSFRGYTNRYAFSKVNDDKHYPGTKVTFDNETVDNNTFDDVAKVGCILGFGAFGLGILAVVAMIAVDMKKRMEMYEELIAEDLQKLDQMGLGAKRREMEAELAARLAGGKEDGGVDDQLVTQALELRHEEYAKHL